MAVTQREQLTSALHAAGLRLSPVEIDALLYGSTPADERALVALAQALTALEQEVLRT